MPGKWSFTSILGMAVVLLSVASAQAHPIKIRINWSVTPAHLTPLIPLIPKNVYRHYGKSYVVKTIKMRGTGPAITALAANDLDVAALSYQGLAVAILNAKVHVEAIADVLQDHPPHVSDGYWVRRNSGINNVKDLRGKVLAVNSLGSGDDAGLRHMLDEHGLTSTTDYTEVEVPFPAMVPEIEAHKIDLGFVVIPFAFRAEKDPKLKELFTLRDSMGPQVTVMWVAKKSYIKAHHAVLVDLLEDQILARRWLKTHRVKMAQLLSRITHRPASDYASWVLTRRDDAYHSPDMMFKVSTLQHNIDEVSQLDKLSRRIHVAKYVDFSLAREAAARLGMH